MCGGDGSDGSGGGSGASAKRAMMMTGGNSSASPPLKASHNSVSSATASMLLLNHTPPRIHTLSSGHEHHLFTTYDTKSLFAMGWNLWGQLGVPTVERNVDQMTEVGFFQGMSVSCVACAPYGSFVVAESGGATRGMRANWVDPDDVPEDEDDELETRQSDELHAPPSSAAHLHGQHLYAFGHNNLGQCGIGSKQERLLTPQMCQFEDRTGDSGDLSFKSIQTPLIEKIAAGYNHTVVLTQEGRVFVAGTNFYGQLGQSSCTRFRPVEMATAARGEAKLDSASNKHAPPLRFKDIACGFEHTVLLAHDDTVYVTGRNACGELGLGHQKPVRFFTQLALFNIQQVHCGYSFSIFVANNGTMWSCGDHTYGSLGIGEDVQKQKYFSTPQLVKFPSDNKKHVESCTMVVSCGARHTVVMLHQDSFVTLEKGVYRSLIDAKLQLEMDLKEHKKIAKEFEEAIHLLQEEDEKKRHCVDVVIHYEGLSERFSFVPADNVERLKHQLCVELMNLPAPNEGKTLDEMYRVQFWDQKFQMYLDLARQHLTGRSWDGTKVVIQPLKVHGEAPGISSIGGGTGTEMNRYWEIDSKHLHLVEADGRNASPHTLTSITAGYNPCTLNVSVKRINLAKAGTARDIISKEVSLISQMNHERILKCIGIAFRLEHNEADIVTEKPYHTNLIRYASEAQLGMTEKLTLLMEVAEGMYHFHRSGLTHHHLSPDTLCVTEEGHVKIVPSLHLAPGQQDFLGQLTYFAPEYYAQNYSSGGNKGDAEKDSNSTTLDHRVDIYSFGIVMWQLLSMQIPYQDLIPLFQQNRTMALLKKIHFSEPPLRPSLRALGEVPEALVALVEKCWHRDAEERYQNFKDVLEALHKLEHSVQLWEKLRFTGGNGFNKNHGSTRSNNSQSSSVGSNSFSAGVEHNDSSGSNTTYAILIKYQDSTKRITAHNVQSVSDLCQHALDALRMSLPLSHFKFLYYDQEFEEYAELDSLEHVSRDGNKLVMSVRRVA